MKSWTKYSVLKLRITSVKIGLIEIITVFWNNTYQIQSIGSGTEFHHFQWWACLMDDHVEVQGTKCFADTANHNAVKLMLHTEFWVPITALPHTPCVTLVNLLAICLGFLVSIDRGGNYASGCVCWTQKQWSVTDKHSLSLESSLSMGLVYGKKETADVVSPRHKLGKKNHSRVSAV